MNFSDKDRRRAERRQDLDSAWNDHADQVLIWPPIILFLCAVFTIIGLIVTVKTLANWALPSWGCL